MLTLPTRTLAASASFTSPAGGGAADFACSVGTYSIQIHAQPYNFRLGPYSDPNSGSHPDGVGKNSNGELHFHYVWSSTDGSLSDLNSCVVYEHISAAGNSTGSYYADSSGTEVYAPLNPPFGYTLEADYNQPDPAASGTPSATAGFIDDIQYRGSIVAYQAASYFTTQDWRFDDSMTKEAKVELLGPLTITRSVSAASADYSKWVYDVVKSGYDNPFPLN